MPGGRQELGINKKSVNFAQGLDVLKLLHGKSRKHLGRGQINRNDERKPASKFLLQKFLLLFFGCVCNFELLGGGFGSFSVCFSSFFPRFLNRSSSCPGRSSQGDNMDKPRTIREIRGVLSYCNIGVEGIGKKHRENLRNLRDTEKAKLWIV